MKYRVKLSPYEIFNLIVLAFISILILVVSFWVYSNIYINNWDASKTYYNNKKPTVVVSESMEPTIMTNSVIVVEKQPFDNVKVGDIVVAEIKEHGMVVHRVIEDNIGVVYKEDTITGIVKEDYDRYLVTKGDNNEKRDTWVVAKENYQGKVVEIHNGLAATITFYFGDITKATPFFILWGLVLMALTISMFLVIIVWLYDFLLIPYFLGLEVKDKKDATTVKIVYYSWLKDRVVEKDAIETIKQIGKERTIIEKIYFNFRLMMWHNAMKAESKKAMKSKRRYEKLKEVFKCGEHHNSSNSKSSRGANKKP